MMAGIYIPGMQMPQTGIYIMSVDNTNGRDKTIITIERVLRNRDVRHIVGAFEIVPVPPHGRLIDADALNYQCGDWYTEEGTEVGFIGPLKALLETVPTIIPASKEETDG